MVFFQRENLQIHHISILLTAIFRQPVKVHAEFTLQMAT